MKRLVIGLVLVLLSGCATRPVMTPQQVAAIKTIGIVSAIGDEMMTMDVPLFGIGSSVTKGPINDLNLDPYMVGQIGDHLKGRFQIIPVAYQSADFRSDGMKTSIGETVRNLTKLPNGGSQSVDAYIVVTTTTVAIRNSGRHVRGAFLARLTTVAGHEHYAGVIYTMTVIDGHDFKTIAAISIGDYDAVSDSYWADSVIALNAAQRQKLKEELQSQLAATVRPALKRLPLAE